LQLFHDGAHRVTTLREPATRPFPSTDMGQGQYHSVAFVHRMFDVRVTLGTESGIDLVVRQ